MNASSEVWKPVVGYEGYYEVSDRGRVRSVDRIIICKGGQVRKLRGKIMSLQSKGDFGHLQVILQRCGEYRHWAVHQLVAVAFIGECPEGMETCHNNGIASDNRAENLRYGTKSENALDQVRHGVHNNARKTHCKRGHEFTPENTKIISDRGWRKCVTCSKQAGRERYLRSRQKIG